MRFTRSDRDASSLAEIDISDDLLQFLAVNIVTLLRTHLWYGNINHPAKNMVSLRLHDVGWATGEMRCGPSPCTTEELNLMLSPYSIERVYNTASDLYLGPLRKLDRAARATIEADLDEVLDATSSSFHANKWRSNNAGFLERVPSVCESPAFEGSDYLVKTGPTCLNDMESFRGASQFKLQRKITDIIHLLLEKSAPHVRAAKMAPRCGEMVGAAMRVTTNAESWLNNFRSWFESILSIMRGVDPDRLRELNRMAVDAWDTFHRSQQLTEVADEDIRLLLATRTSSIPYGVAGEIVDDHGRFVPESLFLCLDDETLESIIVHLGLSDRIALAATCSRMKNLDFMRHGLAFPGPHIGNSCDLSGFFPHGRGQYSCIDRKAVQSNKVAPTVTEFYCLARNDKSVTVVVRFGYYAARPKPLRLVTSQTLQPVPGNVHEGEMYQGERVVLEKPPEHTDFMGPDVAGAKTQIEATVKTKAECETDLKKLERELRDAERDERYADDQYMIAKNAYESAAHSNSLDAQLQKRMRDTRQERDKLRSKRQAIQRKRESKRTDVSNQDLLLRRLNKDVAELEGQRAKWLKQQAPPMCARRDRVFVCTPDGKFFEGLSVFSIMLVDAKTRELIKLDPPRDAIDTFGCMVGKHRIIYDDYGMAGMPIERAMAYLKLRPFNSAEGSAVAPSSLDEIRSTDNDERKKFFERPREIRCSSKHRAQPDWQQRRSLVSILKRGTVPILLRWVKFRALSNKLEGRTFRICVQAHNVYDTAAPKKETLESLRLSGASPESARRTMSSHEGSTGCIYSEPKESCSRVCVRGYSVPFILKSYDGTGKRKRGDAGPSAGPSAGSSVR